MVKPSHHNNSWFATRTSGCGAMPSPFVSSFNRLTNLSFLATKVEAGMLCRAGHMTKHSHIVRRSPPVDCPFGKPTSFKAWQNKCWNQMDCFVTKPQQHETTASLPQNTLTQPPQVAWSSSWHRAFESKHFGRETRQPHPCIHISGPNNTTTCTADGGSPAFPRHHMERLQAMYVRTPSKPDNLT